MMKLNRYSTCDLSRLGLSWILSGEKFALCLSRNPVNPCRNLGFSYRLNVTLPAHSSPTPKSLGSTSETCVTGQDARVSSTSSELNTRSIYVARSTEVDKNWLENRANRWYKAGSSPDDGAGTTRFSGCGRNGSRRELGPNSNSCETTNFMPLDRVLPVELNTHSLGAELPLRAWHRSSLSFSR